MTVVMPRMESAPAAEVPAAWVKAAEAKLARDRKSYAEFRAADQREYEQAYGQHVARGVKSAEDGVRLRRFDVEALEEYAAERLSAFRALEDKARGAAEYARLQREAYERVKGQAGVSAEEETDALIRADAADETAFQARKAADEARAESRDADSDLAQVREALTRAERQLDAAREAAEVPAGVAPISDMTVRACTWLMQADEIWNDLSDRDKQRVRLAGQPRDMMTSEEFWAQFRSARAALGYGESA